MPDRDIAFYRQPQINLTCSTPGRMWTVSLCAAAAVFQSAIADGGASLVIALAAVFASVLTELLLSGKSGRFSIADGSAVASALVLTLLLPNHINPVSAALGAAFATGVIKHTFGGLGGNWLNPAIGGWFFIRFSWPAAFENALEYSPLTLFSNSMAVNADSPAGTPWEILLQSGYGAPNGQITTFLNRSVFSVFKMELPNSYIEFFSPANAGIIADRGLYALLIFSVIMVANGVSRFSFSAVYIAIYAVLVRVGGALPLSGSIGEGDMLFGILSGGTLAAAFFLLPDPSTNAKTLRGKLFNALFAAILTFFFRYVKNTPYGAFFAIAIINVITPIVRQVETTLIFNKIRSKRRIYK